MKSDSEINNWPQIKSIIINNVADDFTPSHPIETLVDYLYRIVYFPVNDSNLSGIPSRFMNALTKVFLSHEDYDIYIPEIANVEKLLRKYVAIIDPAQYSLIKDNKEGLSAIINALSLNPNRINYNWDKLGDSQKSNNAEHLLRVYRFRNTTSHECKTFGEARLFILLQSSLIIYLYAIDLHFSKFNKVFFSPNKYLDIVKNDFKKWQKRFVSIEGKEVPQEIALFAIETPWKKDLNENNKRQGEVAELKKKLIASGEHQMIIVGEAGIGKTTTMQYLSYKDCESGGLPVYVELKLLTAHDTLIDVIKRKLKEASLTFESIIRSPKTCVYLDGLNEILPAIKDSIYREIVGLIKAYPQAFFLISTRSQDYNGELGQIPVFALQKMNKNKIEEFLLKNTDSNTVRDIIRREIEKNENWLRILGTPLILYMLIQVVTMEGDVPDDENKIILRFIRNLYLREKAKDFSFNDNWFHSIICHIAFESIDKVGDTNSGFTFLSIKKLLEKAINIDDKSLMSALQKGVELNILVQDGLLYSFSHQTYQETLAGDYINTLYAQ